MQGATRSGSDHRGQNEDCFRILHDLQCAVVLDGAARAGGAARRLAD
ncbi:MAG TPA: hypothetical protein VMV46_23780 [Thermoanaerobaculia bacterium]|nr:hypothetical protein [Thermoanaerobaculia bacterium]